MTHKSIVSAQPVQSFMLKTQPFWQMDSYMLLATWLAPVGWNALSERLVFVSRYSKAHFGIAWAHPENWCLQKGLSLASAEPKIKLKLNPNISDISDQVREFASLSSFTRWLQFSYELAGKTCICWLLSMSRETVLGWSVYSACSSSSRQWAPGMPKILIVFFVNTISWSWF